MEYKFYIRLKNLKKTNKKIQQMKNCKYSNKVTAFAIQSVKLTIFIKLQVKSGIVIVSHQSQTHHCYFVFIEEL